MKIIITSIIFFILISNTGFAQIENPVQWAFSLKKISEKQYEVYVTATIENKWHVYAQDAGEGPVPTSIIFSPNPLVILNGKVKEEGKLEKIFDPNFKSTLRYYADKVVFIQKIKLKSAASTVLKGIVNYMVCNDKKCLPPKEIPFSLKVGGK